MSDYIGSVDISVGIDVSEFLDECDEGQKKEAIRILSCDLNPDTFIEKIEREECQEIFDCLAEFLEIQTIQEDSLADVLKRVQVEKLMKLDMWQLDRIVKENEL